MLGGDREAEARLPPRARRVGLVEAVEERSRRVRRHARPAVGDDDRRGRRASAISDDLDGPPGAWSRALSTRLPRIRSSRRGSGLDHDPGSSGSRAIAARRQAAS